MGKRPSRGTSSRVVSDTVPVGRVGRKATDHAVVVTVEHRGHRPATPPASSDKRQPRPGRLWTIGQHRPVDDHPAELPIVGGMRTIRKKTCEYPGCEVVVTQPSGEGPPRKYCGKQHRLAARRLRNEERPATPTPPRAAAVPDSVPEAAPTTVPEARRRSRPGRPRLRVAVLAVFFLVAALLASTGDGTPYPSTARARLTPAAAASPSPSVTVTALPAQTLARWSATAARTLRALDGQLRVVADMTRIAATVPGGRRTPALRALQHALAAHQALLTGQRTALQTDLQAYRDYQHTPSGLASRQLRLAMTAPLPDPSPATIRLVQQMIITVTAPAAPPAAGPVIPHRARGTRRHRPAPLTTTHHPRHQAVPTHARTGTADRADNPARPTPAPHRAGRSHTRHRTQAPDHTDRPSAGPHTHPRPAHHDDDRSVHCGHQHTEHVLPL